MTAPTPRPLLLMAVALTLASLVLAACTRERPTPEPTATPAIADAAATRPAPAAPAPAADATNTPAANPEAGIAVTVTPADTPTPGAGDPFPYVVRAGDTLSSIATRFGTDVETLLELNNLDSENILIGQPIYIPYIEGITAEGAPTPTPGPFLYTIQSGDTLSGIGARFGIDPIRIIEANNLPDPNNLTVGVEILIPGYQPQAGDAPAASGTPATSGESIVHIVQPGEGLIGIAATYGVSVDDIVAANGLVDRNTLRVGQQLIIPGISARDLAAARSTPHVVAPGESLLSIAIRYGVTVEEIIELNELDNPDAIFIGQELLIPGN